ncbi:MAG: hypothetical protein HYY93_08375 [Planctomycetes bacterium]|nr:hypothetical protein [Planctomycetota bacterium]
MTIHAERAAAHPAFVTLPFNEVSCEGAYVSKETGRLYQIPASAIEQGHSPRVNVLGPGGEETLVRLSTNPFMPIDRLRTLASQANIEPRF